MNVAVLEVHHTVPIQWKPAVFSKLLVWCDDATVMLLVTHIGVSSVLLACKLLYSQDLHDHSSCQAGFSG